MPSTSNYSLTAISLHWLVAVAIFATFGLGLYMHELPFSPDKLKLYSWHKWAGVTIFMVVLLRIFWRLTHRPPELPMSMLASQRFAADGVHMLLYALMLAIPLSGWFMSSAKGVPTVWFGVLTLPDPLDKNKELGGFLETVHKTLNFGMAGLILVHAGAALKHHLIDRDQVLVRMLPFLKKP